MRFLRLNETRPLASVLAVAAWFACTLAMASADGLSLGAAPIIVMLMPALLAYIAFRAGRATALFCAALGIWQWGAQFGVYAALVAAVILLPAPVYSVYSYERKAPFWRSIGVCAGLLLIGGMAALITANILTGGDAVIAWRDSLETLLRTGADTDQFLVLLANVGWVRLPEDVMPGILLGNHFVFTEAVREELIKQAVFAGEAMLRQSVPSQILQGAMLGGLLSVAWPRRVAARSATQMELAPQVPFHQWHIPRAVSRPLFFTVLAVWLLTMLSGATALISIFNLVWAGVEFLLALQGGAMLAFMMRKGGTRSGFRMLVVCALFVLFRFLLVILGCADQLFNPRALRDAAQEKRDEEDER